MRRHLLPAILAVACLSSTVAALRADLGGAAVGSDPPVTSPVVEARQLTCPDGVVKVFRAGPYVSSDKEAARPTGADAALDSLLSEHYPKLPRGQLTKVGGAKPTSGSSSTPRTRDRLKATFLTEEVAADEYRVEKWDSVHC